MIPSNWGSVDNTTTKEKRSDNEIFGRSLDDIKNGLRGNGDNLVRPNSPSVESFLTRTAVEVESSVKENRPDGSELGIVQALYEAIDHSDHPELKKLALKLNAYMNCPREADDLLALEVSVETGKISIKF